ncbi:MAG: hypothetical protein CL927_06740 [Deltaproteobacteria bacterium]|nr:hypothetical protein [Deltaproteobacteria bacterium]
MAIVRPFRGVRPVDALANRIIALPYDVMNRAEARAMVAAEPRSFLRVTRSDALLDDVVSQHGEVAYQRARSELTAMKREGLLQQDATPCFYLYRQTWRGRTQTGLMALASVAEYDAATIKKHELTRPKKEQDRVDHIEALGAQTGLVFLAWRDAEAQACRELLQRLAERLEPSWSVETSDGVSHALTVIDAPADIQALQSTFAQLDALYVADGHHRSAAASRVCASRGGVDGSDGFLAGLFPDSELQVLAYNRVVRDLNGHSADRFLAGVERNFEITPDVAPEPGERGTFTMRLGKRWYGLKPRAGVVPANDPVGRLDVAVLQERILEPLLGISDPRRDERIQFVGGIRGAAALEAAVDSGNAAVAFHCFPTGMDQLFDVADADRLMPPKSTWFEPKLRGGVVIHEFNH